MLLGHEVQKDAAQDRAVRPTLSVVTAAYNEAQNLPVLYHALRKVLDEMHVEWEWILVDDHSSDETFAAIRDIARLDPRVRGIRFSRNSGSHAAITCGLHQASGRCVAAIAADLQDPPEVLPALFREWQDGAHVVWGIRRERKGEAAVTLAFSRVYYWLMRKVAGLKETPSTGADLFLMDERVLHAFRQFRETNASIMALILWMGFRQTSIVYDKQPRLYGRSGWNLEKKLKLVIDSITSFTYVPIRWMSYAGFTVGLLGFLYAGFILLNAWRGRPVEGWSSIMVAVLVLGGFQMLMMGVLGEYLWRALDESRHRPQYIIEAVAGQAPDWHAKAPVPER